MNSISFYEHCDFDILDPSLLTSAAGGLHIQFGIGGSQTINNGCVQDISNNVCVAPNTFCAADTICAEIV